MNFPSATFVDMVERDLSICAMMAKLAHRDKKFQNLPYFESHVMELVAVVDQDENADILAIGVAFMMDAIANGDVNIMELAQVIMNGELLYSLNNMIRKEDEEPVAHLMRLAEDERARIVKTHDTNLRIRKLDRKKDDKLFVELDRQKSILESLHVQHFPQDQNQDTPLN